MEQIRTKRKFTREQLEQKSIARQKEKARRIAELDAPDLTYEEKEILIGIKMALEEDDSEGYTGDELLEILLEKMAYAHSIQRRK